MPADDLGVSIAGPGDSLGAPMPLSEVATLWTAEPDVIADPSQVEGGRVWTRARDILPGREVVPGHLVHAAFRDESFRALPAWDGVEPDTLWLLPHGKRTGRPSPDRARVRAALTATATSDSDQLSDLVEDLMETIEVLAEAVDSQRRTMQDVVALFNGLDPRTVRSLHSDDLVDRLYRQARRPRPDVL